MTARWPEGESEAPGRRDPSRRRAEGTFGAALRAALGSFVDAPGRYVAVSTLWLVVAGAVVLLAALTPLAYALGLLLVPITAGLVRMAGQAARGRRATLGHWWQGARARPLALLGLSAGQAALIVLSLVNLGTGLAGTGLLAVMVAVVAGYVGLATGVVALATWPLLLDPRRTDVPVATLVRLGITVAVARPLRLVAVAVVAAVLLLLTVQTVLLGLVAPAVGALLAAHVVLPTADALERERRHPADPAVPPPAG